MVTHNKATIKQTGSWQTVVTTIGKLNLGKHYYGRTEVVASNEATKTMHIACTLWKGKTCPSFQIYILEPWCLAIHTNALVVEDEVIATSFVVWSMIILRKLLPS